ncbi:MAG: class I SAM-dependent methyltransferase [Terriglobales bacterium]
MPTESAPNPGLVLGMFTAFQQSAALLTAIRLDLFTAMADGATTAAELAQKTGAATRGVEILCDFLCVGGLLQKQGSRYALSPTADVFLNTHSSASLAPAAAWHERMAADYSVERLSEAVCRGGASPGFGSPETWVCFARSMGVTALKPAAVMAETVAAPLLAGVAAPRVLDIAGGHGFYGIAVARQCTKAEVTILDAAPVLDVARANAQQAGVAARYHTLAGNVLPGGEGEVALPTGIHLVLVTGFCHMFGPAMVESLFRKIRAALAQEGAVLVVEFLPNEDRVSPAIPAAFSLTMLAATAEGRAYTEGDFRSMFAAAGFSRLERHNLGEMPLSALVARV